MLYQVCLSDFLLMGLWYPFVTPTSCVCSNLLRFSHHLVHLPRTQTHVHVVCKQFQWMPCLSPPCFTLGVHAKCMFENWDFVKSWTCIDYDLGIQPMLIRKMHLHYPLPSSNNYYSVCNTCILSNTNCKNINPLVVISTC